MKFKDNIPIYLQIEKYLNRQIITGKLRPGEKIPSVRELAIELTVNLNTVQRALRDINEQGIIYTKRGQGNFVTEDKKLLAQTKKNLIIDELNTFVEEMHKFGIEDSELKTMLNKYLS